MPITSAQRQARRKWIGASDVPAILGEAPWANATPGNIYYEKTAEDLPEERPTPEQTQGNLLEEAIIQLALPRIAPPGAEVQMSPATIGPIEIMGAPYAVNLDGLVRGDGTTVVEAKRRGDVEEWGEEGTDSVPTDVLLQCQCQMEVASIVLDTRIDLAWVPVLMPTYHSIEHRLYAVPRHNDLIQEMFAQCSRFWREHVVPRIPPKGALPPLEMLKRMTREPASVTMWGEDEVKLWQGFEEAKERKRLAEKEVEDHKTRVMAALKSCEAAELPDGRQVTYLEQNSTPSVDHTLLRARWPEVSSVCVTQGRHRVLRIKKAPKR